MIEARLDRTGVPIATLLIQNGTLNQGDVIIAGTAVGPRSGDDQLLWAPVKTHRSSVPVEITGLADVPAPGDRLTPVSRRRRMARELVEQRRQRSNRLFAAQLQ